MRRFCLANILVFLFALSISTQYDKKSNPFSSEKQLVKETQSITKSTNKKYQWPLKINNGFSSSFQEFRSNHFHAGYDLRTFQKTGYPVSAIADGIIYKIRWVKRGSGRGLYLKHDDGKISIYFHLDRFEKKLENLLKRIQQAKKKKYIENYYLKKPLRYKQGDIIGYSGESGSGFPHLHLEIRDQDYFALNPFQLIEFPAKDKNFPFLKKMLIRNNNNGLINGSIGEMVYSFSKRSNNHYISAKPFLVNNPFDLIINAYDISDTGKHVTPYEISAFIDGHQYYHLKFDRFERDDNNQLGFVYDMYYSTPGSYYFNLFNQKGFLLERKNESFQTIVENLDRGKHTLRINIKDNFDNMTTGVIPFYRIHDVELLISNIERTVGKNQLNFIIDTLKSEPPPAGQIKINILDANEKKISTAPLHYHNLSEPKSLVLKDFPPEASFMDFDFYFYNIHYLKKRFLLKKDHLQNTTDLQYKTFLNRDEIFIILQNGNLSQQNLLLTVKQGKDSNIFNAQCSNKELYFHFKPLNQENRMRLHFSVLKEGEKIVEIEKKIDLIFLKPGLKYKFSHQEFSADFATRSVYEPKVLQVEEKNYPSEFPILSRQISLAPYHFPFLDTVYYKFKKKLPQPHQVGIFKYNFFSKKWSYRYTIYDPASDTYKRRVISSGVFALMRDIFSPKMWFVRPKVRYKKNLRRLVVKISDKGKGVNDNSIKIWLNGQRICTAYDSQCEYDPDRSSLIIEELSYLKMGKNSLKVEVKDYAMNKTSKSFYFSLK